MNYRKKNTEVEMKRGRTKEGGDREKTEETHVRQGEKKAKRGTCNIKKKKNIGSKRKKKERQNDRRKQRKIEIDMY